MSFVAASTIIAQVCRSQWGEELCAAQRFSIFGSAVSGVCFVFGTPQKVSNPHKIDEGVPREVYKVRVMRTDTRMANQERS